MAQIKNLKASVEQIKTAVDQQALATLYVEMVGYDPFEDEPANTVQEVRETLLDFVRELCFESGVHCADVGL